MKEKKKLDSNKMWRQWGIVFISFALIFALAPIGIFKILVMQRDTTSWPNVQGTVIICKVLHRVNEYADPGEEDEYRIDLVYQYIVNNETYENSNIYYWGGTGSYWDHKLNSYEYSLLRIYSVGSDVTVYYNPNNPEQSCLITGENPDDRLLIILLPIVGYFCIGCVPLFISLDYFTKKRKSKKKGYKSFTSPELIDKIEEAKES